MKDSFESLSSKPHTCDFMYRNFEIESYACDNKSSNDPLPLSRIRNLITKAHNRFNRLPKYIILVLEDDVVNATDYNDYGLALAYQRLVEWLAREYHRAVLSIKEKLPSKAIANNCPHIIWIAPSLHKNYANNIRRRKYTSALEAASREYSKFEDMQVLRLKAWDSEDTTFYTHLFRRLSDKGALAFWEAVDKAVQYAVTRFEENRLPRHHQHEKKQESTFQRKVNDRYHYYRK